MISRLLFSSLLGIGIALMIPHAGVAADEENPVIAAVKPHLKDANKPFTLVVRLQVKEGSGPKLEQAFAKAITATRKEKGCLTYDLNRDPQSPKDYVVYERWKSLADLEAHLKTAHITTLLADLKDLLATSPEFRAMLPAGE